MTTIVDIRRQKVKVNSSDELLLKLVARIWSYLNSVLRYKFLISHPYHPDTLYLRQQGYEDQLLFFFSKPKGGP